LGPAGPNASISLVHIHAGVVFDRFPPGPRARDDIGRIHALGSPLDLQLREHRAVIGQMIAVHDVSMRIDISVGYQSPFAMVRLSAEVGLSGGTLRHLKVRAVLVGKEAVEDMIALVRAGCRHVDAPPGIAVEVASHDPEQGDGPARIVELIERIEVALAILGSSRREGLQQLFRAGYRREAGCPNAIWQTDHTPLGIELVRSELDPTRTAKPWLTARKRTARVGPRL
jgi:hypothetical protein